MMRSMMLASVLSLMFGVTVVSAADPVTPAVASKVAGAKGGKQTPGKAFDKIDTNHDGSISKAEFTAAMAKAKQHKKGTTAAKTVK